MTDREKTEAIKELKNLKENYWDDGYGHETKQYDDTMLALDIAIKALEQELTPKDNLAVDCISRVQAQTEIQMHASRYTIAKERGGMGQVEWSDQLIKVSDAIDIIRNLPSVTPIQKKGKWIKRHTDEKYDFFGYRVKVATYECSVCGRIIEDIGTYGLTNRIENYPYCHCGAKMERK